MTRGPESAHACDVQGDFSQDTIVAIATPPGEGGIGVLRLSGPRAREAAGRLWKGKIPPAEFESHRMYFGKWCDPKTGETLDSGLMVWMQAPRSYTGEEVVELQLHGGPLLLGRMLELLLREGLRAAEPGEFTRRAFLNGKLDLLQAEAVAELIHAKSEAALRNARAQLEGRISSEVQGLRVRVVALCAQLEAAIDFPEEDLELVSCAELAQQVRALEAELGGWLERFQVGRLLREGVKVALVGRPNVGKSSLLNRLLGQDRAIVHPRPGTTRDVIEAWLEWEGLPLQLFDTAGIREGREEVEQEGIRRSQRAAEQADLSLWVLDASEPLSAEDLQVAELLRGNILPVANKMDLVSPAPVWKELPQRPGMSAPCQVSAHSGTGLAELKQRILASLGLEGLRLREQAFLNNARHREALERGLEALARARDALEARQALELPAAELRSACLALEGLLGRVGSEDILGEIFSHFCIGK
ncbi:MAG: tRNA uridine-5-carboxymethylaminomethyl(34) synthesis GTPase MnmE [bacterium]